ncbi:MAG: SDR family oxidoreductase [Jatrophihabitans sp.]|uniref:SDR family oxidoreductase n=1 Tax=Jatrophihabitans sp. TaxID=1932789 RepID=UPI003F7F21BB
MPTVLITGAGRGIGRAASLRMAAAGWNVVAGVRRDQDGDELVAEAPTRITAVRLDVTSDDDVATLPDRLPDRLDAVVNNAGIVVGGPIEAVPLAELRRQFEVNVVGQVAVTQAVLPRLRRSKGRVVFVSSISGLVSNPMIGPYAASKFALEAVADALRVEVRPWGIAVSLIEPGQIDTDLWRQADSALDETIAGISPEHRQLYGRHIEGMRKAIPLMRKMASPADGVAGAIEQALTARRPRARYLVGSGARLQGWLPQYLPTRAVDSGLRLGLRIPRKI